MRTVWVHKDPSWQSHLDDVDRCYPTVVVVVVLGHLQEGECMRTLPCPKMTPTPSPKCFCGHVLWIQCSDWLTIPCCATGPLSGVQVYCTQKSFWLCPCCCWVRCLWWCRTGDKRERSRLWGEAELDCFDTKILSAMGLWCIFLYVSSPAHIMSTTTMMMSSPALNWVVWPTSSIVTSSKEVNTMSFKIHLYYLNVLFMEM